MAERLAEVMRIVERQNEYIIHLEKQAQELKSDVIINQGTVIDLQQELIAAKNEQLTELKTTVVTSVEDTVKTELKSYSEAVNQSSNRLNAGTLYDQKMLKSVVKDVVAEEDRSRNLMLFGLEEEQEEHISEKVSQVPVELGEKPIIEASRIGVKLKDYKAAKKPARPVKVTVSSSTIVQQILSKARSLRNSEYYKKVFISADRSTEQRAQHRELVQELKRRRTEEPDKRFYIRGGQLCSVE